jgi:ATPase subunit of ABC transporter with duplicated ATPase domains
MSFLRLHDVSKSYDRTWILRSVFFRLSEGDRVGLVGRNGTGKTTLLRLIMGTEEPTEGEVQIEEGVRLGYVSQFSELDGDRCLEELLDALFVEVHTIEAELLQLEAALAAQPDTKSMDRLLHRQSTLHDRMLQIDGWNYRNQIDICLSRLGFSAEHRQRPVAALSGGWRNRAALAHVLLADPDVLLLDEPTNFLDVDGLAWLEQWLNKRRGPLLLVSHDRHFLDLVVNRIVEIENHQLQMYEGNYTAYVREKPTRRRQLENQYQHEQEMLAYEAEASEERREMQRNPSQALRRRLANISKTSEPRPVERIVTGLYQGLRVRDSLCRVDLLAREYDEQILFLDLTFEVRRGQRLVVVGPNGCGKSSLLRLLTLQEAPSDGTVTWQAGVEFVDFGQVFADLDPDDTVSHAANTLKLTHFEPRRQVHQFLSLMRFSEMDLQQKIGTLSGGQKARVALVQCLLSGASVVVLDEPTNHLDVASIQVMERALLHFPGAVIAVSHDRFFIDKIANRLLVFEEDGEVRHFEGNWTHYQTTRAGEPGG